MLFQCQKLTNTDGVSHKKSTKKYWFIYYYDEEGYLHSEQVSYLKAMYYKKQKLRRMKCICLECGQVFVGLVKSPKQEIECPYCEALVVSVKLCAQILFGIARIFLDHIGNCCFCGYFHCFDKKMV